MKIRILKHHNKYKLIRRLKNITMLKDSHNYIYEHAFISIEKVNTDCLVPPQNYVLNPELKNKLELKYAFEEADIDIFNLDGYVEFSLEGDDTIRTLLPPVVEESIENDGMIIPIINDGMHRIYLARIEKKPIEVIFIRGVSRNFPYYAYPVIGGWESVKAVDELTPGTIKKWHRIQDNKKLYRNFDSVFKCCSKPRDIK